MAYSWRNRTSLHLPIWTSVVLLTVNITLLVFFIVLLYRESVIGALTTGTIAISLGLVGLGFYVFLTIKEIRLNRRQANFVDSVTHELKTPIASLKLYLETLQMRTLDNARRGEFYGVMETELKRLDRLINQLLEVGRLDAIGHEGVAEDVALEPLLQRCAAAACTHHKCQVEKVVTFDIEPAVIRARPMVLEMIFGNLLDNSIKYSPDDVAVEIQVRVGDRGRVVTRIADNGRGVPADMRKKIFQLFYRGGTELERSTKGTGLGLHIVRTLVHILKGRISVYDREGQPGSVFEVELPGNSPSCAS